MLKERGGKDDLVGLPTGFNTLDYATRGLQPGELYSIIGLMKAGKSTMMMSIGQHLQQHGVPVYYVNFEMPVVVQKSRYLALGAHVDYDKLERNTLKKTEWRKVDEFVQESSEWPASFIHCTDMQRSATVEGLESLVLRNEPGVLMVDGIYFMRDSETKQSGTDWKAFTNITRGMKRLAQQHPLPVIVSHQATEGKTRRDSQRRGWRRLDMFSAAYGQNLGQDSDVMIGIEFDEEREDERLIKIMASRHCTPGHEKWVPWDWMNGFIGDKEEVDLTEYGDDDDEA
jgi:replicative DNA helicase